MRNFGLFVFSSLFLLIGCSSQPSMMEAQSFDSSSSAVNRYVIKSADVDLTVEDIDRSSDEISALASNYDGYVQSSNRYTEKRARMQVKVSAERLDEFLSTLSGFGEVTSKSTQSRDVTEEMIDMDARLDNLIALRTRYREILEKAATVKEIIEVENELAKIQTEIDSIEGRRSAMQGQVELSTVDISLQKKTVYGPLGYIGNGVVWVLSKLFVIE